MSEAVIWKTVARAVGKACGIKHIRAASIDASMETGVVEITVTFLATQEQVRALGEALGEPVLPEPRREPPIVPQPTGGR